MAVTQGIIVLEGADCSGKTTLARWFIQNRGARYIHLRPSKDVFMRQLASYKLAERWASRGELVVIDRHWISELAYGDCLRNGAREPISLRFFDRLFLRSAAMTMLCVPSDSEKHLAYFKENKDRRNEMYNAESVSKVIRYYQWLAGYSKEQEHEYALTDYAVTLQQSLDQRPDFQVYDFQTEGEDLDAYCEMLLLHLSQLRKSQYPGGLDEETPNFAGCTQTADTLLVGDRAEGPKIRYPFGSHDSIMSPGLWMNRALDLLDVPEHKLCWVNAVGWPGTETSPELLDLLDDKAYRWKKVVALGQTAGRHLRSCGLAEGKDYAVIPHPRHAGSFKHRDHHWWVMQLEEAMGLDK